MAQLAKTEKSQVPAQQVSFEDEMLQDSGAGLEGVHSDDLAIPFLAIIQSNSPQRKKSDGSYIPGADEGMVFNNVTNELFSEDDGVWLVPCYFESKYIQWREREAGGGFMGTYDVNDPILQQTQRDGAKERLGDGTYLVKTAQYYCLQVLNDGSWKRVVVPMSSTQLKKSRRWNTMIMEQTRVHSKTGKRYTPPSYATMFHLTTQAEENDKGSWYGWRINEAKPVEDYDLFQAAKQFKESIAKGEVQVSSPPDVEGSATSSTVDDTDIPF